MPWADRHIDKLRKGEAVRCRVHGNSMRGLIESGQQVLLDPDLEPEVGKAVLCRCRGSQYVHLVKAIQGHGSRRRFLIGNNRGGTNGWVGRKAIYGVVTEVMD